MIEAGSGKVSFGRADNETENLRARVKELEAALNLQSGISVKVVAPGDNVLLQRYLNTPILRTMLGRLPWLVSLLLLQSCAAFVMHEFEVLLEQELVIAFFIPMIVGTGGNSGNQPGVAVTRALGLGHVGSGTMKRIFFREALAGVLTATVLAVTAFIRVLAEYPNDIRAAGAISLSLFVMVNLSVSLGVGLSMTMDYLRLDPANGAAPVLSTVADILGISVLMGIASALFGISR